MRKILVAALTAVLVCLMAVPAHAEVRYVRYVVDGDTIRLQNGVYVRFIGIDTPERGQCGYWAAKNALDAMIGSRVYLRNPASVDDRDRYGRWLRYVEVGDRDTGLALIKRGLAKARYDSLDGYDWHPRQRTYRTADRYSRDYCS